MATLCIVRHGETAWNAEGRVQGQTDVPLSEVGHAQARALVAALAGARFAALYSSDLLRVLQTAEPVARALGMEVTVDAALRERHYGIFETLTYAEAKERFPQDFARFKRKDPAYDFRTGESLENFHRRSLAVLAAIATRHVGEEVLVFTHGGVLDMLYRRATGMDLSALRDFEVPNAALNRVRIAGDAWEVLAWAERAHLEDALDDLPE